MRAGMLAFPRLICDVRARTKNPRAHVHLQCQWFPYILCVACVSVSSEMHAPGNWHLDKTSVAVLASILNGVSAGDVSA